jgi:uncharacterized protein
VTLHAIADTAAAPVSGTERIDVLDVIRGVAVFGILLMNIVPLSGALMFNLDGNPAALPGARFDGACEFLLEFVAHAKFYSLFSLLFGVGFAIFLERAEKRGAGAVRLFRRRLIGLLIIGLVHAIFIWFGDILNVYALLGFFLIPFRRASNRTLLVAGAALCVSPIVIYGLALLVRIALGGGTAPAPAGDGMPPFLAEAIRAFGSGTYGDVVKGNVIFTLAGWVRRIVTMFLPRMLGMFLFGLWAHRVGLFRAPERHRILLVRVCVWSFAIGAPASALGAWMGDPGVPLIPDARGFAWTILLSIGSTGLCFFYASGLTLLFQRPMWRPWLLVLAPVGGTALTNYMLQSVLGIAIFYRLGFGLYSRVSLVTALAIGCAIYAAQIALSTLWLRRAAYGPAEWLWRQFTYGRRFPLWRVAN